MARSAVERVLRRWECGLDVAVERGKGKVNAGLTILELAEGG